MNIYKQLGVKTIINGFGTVSKIGGSVMAPEVLQAMTEASKHYVEINTLHRAAGKYIAELLESEACCITCGAAAGIALATAACIARNDPVKRLQLPNVEGMKNEVLMLKCHRILYDQALLLSGAKVVEIGATSFAMPEQVEAAINEKTAMFFYVSENESMRGSIELPRLIPILKKRDVPVVVDAAAELPPRSNISKYQKMGADLVLFSGGKELRGPQSSGLILGRKDLVEACQASSSPNYSIARSMKIDKETIAGITRAVELFLEKDYEKIYETWTKMSNFMATEIDKCGKAFVRTGFPHEAGIQPAKILRVYIQPKEKTAQEVYDRLLSLDPQIYTDIRGGEIVINPQCLNESELKSIVDAIVGNLS